MTRIGKHSAFLLIAFMASSVSAKSFDMVEPKNRNAISTNEKSILIAQEELRKPVPEQKIVTILKIPDRGYCLNLHTNSGSDTTPINLWPCNNSDSQKWIIDGNQIHPFSYPNKCLNVVQNIQEDGTRINITNCNKHESQTWYVGSDWTIRSGGSKMKDRCLNLQNDQLSDNAEVNLWSCNGHKSQHWLEY